MAKDYFQAVVGQIDMNSNGDQTTVRVMDCGHRHRSVETAEKCMYECKVSYSKYDWDIWHNDCSDEGVYYRNSVDYVDSIHDQIERCWIDEDNRGNENGGYLFMNMDILNRE